VVVVLTKRRRRPWVFPRGRSSFSNRNNHGRRGLWTAQLAWMGPNSLLPSKARACAWTTSF